MLGLRGCRLMLFETDGGGSGLSGSEVESRWAWGLGGGHPG